MNKFRKRLEKQKSILSKRLEKRKKLSPNRRFRAIPRRFNQKRRQRLLLARADQHLNEVKNAIQRLDEGEFGRCVICGERIDPERLEALPTVSYCWRCQQEHP